MSDEIANTILKELRAFRTEEEKRWEENEKRWERNNIRLGSLEEATRENTKSILTLTSQVTTLEVKVSDLEKATKENTERIISLEKATKENTERITSLEGKVDSLEKVTKENTERITSLEGKVDSLEKATKENTEGINKIIRDRKVSRISLENIITQIDFTIENKFRSLEETINKNFNKFQEAVLNNDKEHNYFRGLLKEEKEKYPELEERVEDLEDWRDEIEGSLFSV